MSAVVVECYPFSPFSVRISPFHIMRARELFLSCRKNGSVISRFVSFHQKVFRLCRNSFYFSYRIRNFCEIKSFHLFVLNKTKFCMSIGEMLIHIFLKDIEYIRRSLPVKFLSITSHFTWIVTANYLINLSWIYKWA